MTVEIVPDRYDRALSTTWADFALARRSIPYLAIW
jgi:hypothetical protein